MSRWEGIDEFLQVVHVGSFIGAAKRMGVSKSYISKQISQLEERMKARLLQRTTRKLTLTDVGEMFYHQCLLMSEQYEKAESAIADMQQTPRGTLKLAINSRFGVQYMAQAVAEFSLLYPDLFVEVNSSFHDIDLVAEGYDLTIRYGRLEDSSLFARKLGSYSLSLYASPDYWARHKQPTSIEDLSQHNCLIGLDRYWLFDRRPSGTEKVNVTGNWLSEDGANLMTAAKAGIGIAQLPDFYVQQAVEAGHLVKVHQPWSYYTRESWAVYPHNRHLSAKVRYFVDFLSSYIENTLTLESEKFVDPSTVL